MPPSTHPIFWRDTALPFVELRQVADGRHVSYTPHFHKEWSIGAILAGKSEFVCEGRLHKVKAGTLVMMNPNVVHACNPLQDSPWAYYMMHLDKQWLSSLLSNTKVTARAEWQDTPLDTLDIPSFYEEFTTVCTHLMSTSFSSNQKHESLQNYLLSLFTHLYNTIENPPPIPPINTLYKVANYLNQYCLENTPIKRLSAEFGLSTGYLNRTFKQQFNMTPHAYRLNCRIQSTQEALKAGNTIVEVAHDAGFSDQAHFQRVFKQRVAATPNQYRHTVC
ncbi:AraC family transcriptional regulator [Paraglaciecola marina]|uniref:AraC family transcriptional regulator n=1 Tax=Paraglaciecola marina TaxID=2500157 RepID=UPI00105EC971|nr:AraC family transcriptional regulator [Paraglaciecola marina]